MDSHDRVGGELLPNGVRLFEHTVYSDTREQTLVVSREGGVVQLKDADGSKVFGVGVSLLPGEARHLGRLLIEAADALLEVDDKPLSGGAVAADRAAGQAVAGGGEKVDDIRLRAIALLDELLDKLRDNRPGGE